MTSPLISPFPIKFQLISPPLTPLNSPESFNYPKTAKLKRRRLIPLLLLISLLVISCLIVGLFFVFTVSLSIHLDNYWLGRTSSKEWKPLNSTLLNGELLNHSILSRNYFNHLVNVEPLWYTPLKSTTLSIDSNNNTILYLLLVHSENTLFSSIHFIQAAPNNSRFILHIDQKYSPPSSLLKSFKLMFPHDKLHYSSYSINVKWGNVNMMYAELLSLYDSLSINWNHVIILSGDSFPISSHSTITDTLNKLNQSNNVLFYYNPAKVCHFKSSGWEEHCKKQEGICLDSTCSKMINTPGQGVVFKGLQWNILSRNLVQDLFKDTLANDWLKFFENSHASDEMFFPTYIMNNPKYSSHVLGNSALHLSNHFKLEPSSSPPSSNDSVGQIDFLYLHWNNYNGGCKSYDSTQPWGWSPCQLGPRDYQEIVDSKALFARKFSPGDVNLLEKIVNTWPKDDYTPLFRITRKSSGVTFGIFKKVKNVMKSIWYRIKFCIIWHIDSIRDTFGHHATRLVLMNSYKEL